MENMKDKFLPIGSVVLLKGGKKNVMVTSYLIFSTGKDSEKKLYDYGGCEYPEGIIDSKVAVGFNHEDIEKIIHLGLEDEDFKTLNDALVEHGSVIKEHFAEMVENDKEE